MKVRELVSIAAQALVYVLAWIVLMVTIGFACGVAWSLGSRAFKVGAGLFTSLMLLAVPCFAGTPIGAPSPNPQPSAARPAHGSASAMISDRLLDAIELIESGGNPAAVGDGGRSRGSFQFKRIAWDQANRMRARRGLRPVSYALAHDRTVAREQARDLLWWLSSTFTAAPNRAPKTAELFAVWNLGPEGFRRRGFSLANCPESTRRAAARLVAMLAN